MMLAISQLLYEHPPKKNSSSGFLSVEKGYNTPVPGGHVDPFSHRAQSGPGPHLLTLDFIYMPSGFMIMDYGKIFHTDTKTWES